MSGHNQERRLYVTVSGLQLGFIHAGTPGVHHLRALVSLCTNTTGVVLVRAPNHMDLGTHPPPPGWNTVSSDILTADCLGGVRGWPQLHRSLPYKTGVEVIHPILRGHSPHPSRSTLITLSGEMGVSPFKQGSIGRGLVAAAAGFLNYSVEFSTIVVKITCFKWLMYKLRKLTMFVGDIKINFLM